MEPERGIARNRLSVRRKPCAPRQGLPWPEFVDDGRGFAVVLYRSAFTAASLTQLELNQRQITALLTAGQGGELTTAMYRAITGAPAGTAFRDIHDLEQRGFLKRIGSSRTTRYQVRPGPARV